MNFIVLLLLVFSAAYAQRAVRLSEQQSMLFSRGAFTTGRRSSGLPQLQCVGPSSCAFAVPEVVACQNIGLASNGDPNWKCEAGLPDGVRFGRTDVSCEGYAFPDDPFILEGSCGLEYTLVGSPRVSTTTTTTATTSNDTNVLVWFLLIMMFFLFLACLLEGPTSRVERTYVREEPGAERVVRERVYVREEPRVHHHYDSGPGFWSGYYMGSVRPAAATTVHHHHGAATAPTTTTTTHSSSTPTTTTPSVGFGSTKRR